MNNIVLTDEQEKLINEAVKWYYNSSELVFQYEGFGGTGKSLVMHMIQERLGLVDEEVAPMAYTGAASIVMRLNGFSNACTIHSWLYKLVKVKDYDTNTNKMIYKTKFVYSPLNKNLIKLIFIDEASMVPFSMKKDIESNGIKIIACGDLNQLPPIGDKPAYLYSGKIFRLTKIMRQARGSAIIELSNQIIKGIEPRPGDYGQVLVINKNDLTREMLYKMEMVICGTNKTRDIINNMVRHDVIKTNNPLPQYGEKIVCRSNDWSIVVDGISLANGLVGTVINYPSIAGFNNNKFYIDFRPDLFPNIEFYDVECDYKYMISDYRTRQGLRSITNKKNNHRVHKFEYAYAITTHISQGSQFQNGMYVQEYLGRDIQNKLNYTGLTRFRNFCIYVLPYKRVFCPVYKSVVSVNNVPVI